MLLEAQNDSLPAPPSFNTDTLTNAECYNRGLNFYQAEEFLQAGLCLDSCLMLDSSFVEARYLKALSLEKQGDLKGAMAEFERIKAERPGFEDIDKRLNTYYITTYLSKKWYYMLAMLFVVILFMVVVARFVPHRKW
ncbi:MAG: hypothetical protein V4615_03645 [Bacteroidota bacterium]